MRNIEVSDSVFQQLQGLAIPFMDTPNSVIERLLTQANGGRRAALAPSSPPVQSDVGNVASAATSDDGVYTFKKPVAFTFNGHTHAVSTFKDIYLHLCREMAARHADSFDRVLNLRGRDRAYFAISRENMTHPQRIEGTNIFARSE